MRRLGFALFLAIITRLRPSDLPNLPHNISIELQRRGCTIPQAPGWNNVIKGQFAKPGQIDWAVLCSVKGVSSILIFWNGSEINPADIEPGDDENRIEKSADNKTFYDRAIDPVGKSYIMEHYKAYGGEKPPPIDHQGVNDIFVGKASVVLYFYHGKWLHLAGAD